MKKFVSVILAVSMILSMSSTAFAVNVNDLAFRESSVEMDIAEINTDEIIGREYLISEEVLSNGICSKYTALNHTDGSVTYRYYENDIKVREYNVVPGSGQYTVRDYRSEASVSSVAQEPAEKVVYVGKAEKVNPVQRAAAGYEYWGTASYYNQWMDETYTVYCTIKEDTNGLGSFSAGGYYYDKLSFIAGVVAFFLWPTKSPLEKAADKIFDNARTKKFILECVLADGTIQFVVDKVFRVDAEYTQYHIHGKGLNGNPSGEFQSDDGYKAHIAADQGIFSGKTYSAIWTRDDWRNPTLGRLLFWNVYGNEYTPTSWNP